MNERKSPGGNGLVQAYEELRRQALGGHHGHTSGLALFIHRGMLAWMRAWSSITPVPEPCPTPDWGAQHGSKVVFPAHLHGEVTRVLVGMALGADGG